VSEWLYERRTKPRANKNPGNSAQNPGDSTQKAGCFRLSNRAETPNTQDNLTQDNLTQDIKSFGSCTADAEQSLPDEQDSIPASAAIHAKRGKRVLWGTAEDLTCATWLRDTRARAFKSKGLTVPKDPDLAGWANDIRLMREHDGRSHREICELFAFVCGHGRELEFCQVPSKLRAQWDALSLKRANAKQGVTGRAKPLSNLAAAQAAVQELKSQGVGYADDQPLG